MRWPTTATHATKSLPDAGTPTNRHVHETLGLSALVRNTDSVVVCQAATEEPGDAKHGKSQSRQRELTDSHGVAIGVAAVPPEKVHDVGTHDEQVKAHMGHSRSESGCPTRDCQQVEQSNRRGENRTDDTDRD